MRKLLLITFISLFASAFMCSSSDTFSKMPFKKSEISDTKTTYRAVASGSSSMMNIARSNAMNSCRVELAKKAGFTKEIEVKDGDGNVVKKTVIEGTLRNVKVIKNMMEADPKTEIYTCWIIMEMPRKQ